MLCSFDNIFVCPLYMIRRDSASDREENKDKNNAIVSNMQYVSCDQIVE